MIKNTDVETVLELAGYHFQELIMAFAKAEETILMGQEDDYYGFTNTNSVVRAGLFFAAYSYFEGSLFLVCENLYNPNVRITVKDLSGNGIEKYKVYIEKVLLLDFPKESPEWSKLNFLNTIRNHMIHNGASYKEVNPKVSKAVSQFEGITINKHNRVEITTNDFIRDEVLFTMHRFLELLMDSIKK
ncbi:hypothetical protein [Paenibacillus sp. P46E]|uniref:hypothetical protein n=1 Tax=Paenibacillus sp. P46E TaxID=1349436 RepID=UPI000AF24E93|nr:hypothetical protein [Paenibacillus sp. P46E]